MEIERGPPPASKQQNVWRCGERRPSQLEDARANPHFPRPLQRRLIPPLRGRETPASVAGIKSPLS